VVWVRVRKTADSNICSAIRREVITILRLGQTSKFSGTPLTAVPDCFDFEHVPRISDFIKGTVYAFEQIKYHGGIAAGAPCREARAETEIPNDILVLFTKLGSADFVTRILTYLQTLRWCLDTNQQ
jgi:hypothetical protein